MKITAHERLYALRAIRAMRCRTQNPERLRNFIKINYRVLITLAYARQLWRREYKGK